MHRLLVDDLLVLVVDEKHGVAGLVIADDDGEVVGAGAKTYGSSVGPIEQDVARRSKFGDFATFGIENRDDARENGDGVLAGDENVRGSGFGGPAGNGEMHDKEVGSVIGE